MKLGLYGLNMGAMADPTVCVEAARAAEAAGYDSLWAGEHVVLPDPRTPESPLQPQHPTLDPVVALSHLAAATTRIRLATGIIILPQRNPLVLAKELTTLDVLSRGRLIFGIGVGYLKPEFDAIGVPFHERGARTDEYLAAILALWTQAKPAFDGRFARFSGIDAQPRPPQRPHPPVVVGGATEAAFHRAVAAGDGWYGFNLDVDTTARHVASLKAAVVKANRTAALEISITPPGRQALDLATAERYRDLGVDRLVVTLRAREPAAIIAEIGETAERLKPLLTR
jgi:probable F420-dependent oxidoreductase